MSVLIKGMDIPDSCNKCDLISTSFDWFHCPVGKQPDGRVLDLENKNDELIYRESRHPQCPLIPIPEKHGRLIDAEDLRRKMYRETFETDNPMMKWDSGCWIRYKMFEKAEENAPTIIEAEE